MLVWDKPQEQLLKIHESASSATLPQCFIFLNHIQLAARPESMKRQFRYLFPAITSRAFDDSLTHQILFCWQWILACPPNQNFCHSSLSRTLCSSSNLIYSSDFKNQYPNLLVYIPLLVNSQNKVSSTSHLKSGMDLINYASQGWICYLSSHSSTALYFRQSKSPL